MGKTSWHGRPARGTRAGCPYHTSTGGWLQVSQGNESKREMSGSKKLVVGIVGVANFGAYRRKQMRAAGCFDVTAVCDRNPEWLAAAAKEEGARAYDDFDAAFKATLTAWLRSTAP